MVDRVVLRNFELLSELGETKPCDAWEVGTGGEGNIDMEHFSQIGQENGMDFFKLFFILDEARYLPMLLVMVKHPLQVFLCWCFPVLKHGQVAIELSRVIRLALQLLDEQGYAFPADRCCALVEKELVADGIGEVATAAQVRDVRVFFKAALSRVYLGVDFCVG